MTDRFPVGSYLLHQLSLEMDLDFFVMFSSMASIVGNMGQSSYSACNAFQDSLAQYRRHVLGLPGLAINWGPISGAGVMQRETGVAKLLSTAGLGFIRAKDGMLSVYSQTFKTPSCICSFKHYKRCLGVQMYQQSCYQFTRKYVLKMITSP